MIHFVLYNKILFMGAKFAKKEIRVATPKTYSKMRSAFYCNNVRNFKISIYLLSEVNGKVLSHTPALEDHQPGGY